MAKTSIQYRVDDDVYRQLEELAEEAKIRGVKNASPNKIARSLMQTALGIDKPRQVSLEVMIQTYALRQQLNAVLGEMIAENLDEMLRKASESS